MVSILLTLRSRGRFFHVICGQCELVAGYEESRARAFVRTDDVCFLGEAHAPLMFGRLRDKGTVRVVLCARYITDNAALTASMWVRFALILSRGAGSCKARHRQRDGVVAGGGWGEMCGGGRKEKLWDGRRQIYFTYATKYNTCTNMEC